MKKVLFISTLVLCLVGCAVGIDQRAVIVPSVDGKKTFAVSGNRLYTTNNPPKEDALRYVAEGMKLACPKGVVPTKDFMAALTPNWAGVEWLQWSGPVHCKE